MTLAASGFHFVDRAGRFINRAQWAELDRTDDYKEVRKFDNGIVRVNLIWYGALSRREFNTFRETWPVYSLRVMNYREDGSIVPDPVMDGKTFPDEESAIKGYEEFLIRWTTCEIDDKGAFVEKDNLLAPPPPPDPDAPQSVLATDSVSEFTPW